MTIVEVRILNALRSKKELTYNKFSQESVDQKRIKKFSEMNTSSVTLAIKFEGNYRAYGSTKVKGIHSLDTSFARCIEKASLEDKTYFPVLYH